MKKIEVRLRERSYPIIVSTRCLSKLVPVLKKMGIGNDAVIITNPNIWSLYKTILLKTFKAFNPSVIKMPDTETSKSNRQVVKIIESMVKSDKGRGIFIVAFGGGVVGDVAGFVASIYKRGVPYIQIPTTLLAQVDSAIGGKVAIDLSFAKNLVGAFYQPRLVMSDTHFLKSLPPRQIKSGLAEIIKCGVIKDRRLFEFLENNIERVKKLNSESLEYIISRSAAIKAKIVELDEFDKKSIRVILNYGHTIGHALEAASKYSKLYSHGEAVAAGMVAAAKIAKSMGVLGEPSLHRIVDLIKRSGLPITISKRLKISNIMKAQKFDKKILHGVNRFILPVAIGRVEIYENISHTLIHDVISSMQKGDCYARSRL